MRVKVSERGLLFLTYFLLILLFLRAQLASGPYEQAIRARINQPASAQAQANH